MNPRELALRLVPGNAVAGVEIPVALVVFLRGVNVGGHKRFRPSTLEHELRHLNVVNIGAAGTLVIRKPVSAARVRDEIARELPFEAVIITCQGRDILRLASRDFFSGYSVGRDLVPFVSVLARSPHSAPAMPLSIPSKGRWLVRALALEKRFLVGVYRREMKAIGGLATLDRVFGVPLTTRNWNTIGSIAEVLRAGRGLRRSD